MLSRIFDIPSTSHFKIAVSILLGLFVIFLILTSNTLFGKLPGMPPLFYGVVLALAFVLCALLALKHTPNFSFLYHWCIWIIFLVVVYISIAFFNARLGSIPLKIYFIVLGICPFLIHSLRKAGLLQTLFNFFILGMTTLAVLSLLMWVLGDLLHLIKPNCTIYYSWTSEPLTMTGYFFMQFDLQRTTLPILQDVTIFRNSGIFTEAPMFSFSLSCAFLLELFKHDRTRLSISIILGIAILSTFSFTGIAISVMALFLKLLINAKNRTQKTIFVAIFLTLGILVFYFIGVKRFSLGGSSLFRIDDFKACFTAWLNSPLFGNGFENTASIKTFMDSARIHNVGLSNSLGVILAQGGIIYLLPNLVSIFGFILIKSTKDGKHSSMHHYDMNHLIFGICFIIMWAITIVHTLPLTALLLSLGVERFLSNANLLLKKKISY